jgi:hypothetical protein
MIGLLILMLMGAVAEMATLSAVIPFLELPQSRRNRPVPEVTPNPRLAQRAVDLSAAGRYLPRHRTHVGRRADPPAGPVGRLSHFLWTGRGFSLTYA